jgi:nucleotide-binding universal stress UspA family protein
MKTIDVASGEVPSAGDMRRLRQHHIEEVVTPLLYQASDLLQKNTGDYSSDLIILDGDPVKRIDQVCRDRNYSTLIMSRRNRAEHTAKLTGSVVTGVLHRHVDATLYLVGDEPLPEGVSPFARCLVGIDGSPASKNAVKEAGMLLKEAGHEVERVFLVHVLDQSCYYDEDGVTCMEAGAFGQKALEEAGNLLMETGVDQEKITTVIHFGKPGTILAEEAISCDATLIFMGRRDRSRTAQAFLGSVCTDMIQNCRERTIVLSS